MEKDAIGRPRKKISDEKSRVWQINKFVIAKLMTVNKNKIVNWCEPPPRSKLSAMGAMKL